MARITETQLVQRRAEKLAYIQGMAKELLTDACESGDEYLIEIECKTFLHATAQVRNEYRRTRHFIDSLDFVPEHSI